VFLLFLVSVYMISSWNNASIFNLSIFTGGKVNLDGAFRRWKFKIPSSFQKHLEKMAYLNQVYNLKILFVGTWYIKSG